MKLSSENRCLGCFRSPKLPPGPAGTVDVQLRMRLDARGLLHASAHLGDVSTTFQLNYRTKMASREEVEKMHRDLQARGKKTRDEMQTLRAKNALVRELEVAKSTLRQVG